MKCGRIFQWEPIWLHSGSERSKKMRMSDSKEGVTMLAINQDRLWTRRLFVSSFLLAILLLLQSCAPKQTLNPSPQPAEYLPRTVVLSFSPNSGGAAPQRSPESAEEWVHCGLFEYNHGNFAEAAHAFGEASRATLNPMTPFVRETLLAQAVCFLRDANDIDFIKVMEELLTSYNRWELSQARERDPRLRALEEFYNQRISIVP
jgi:hypothetical protein